MIKFATDITAQKQANAESDGKIKAISKSQAVIEFSLDGTILSVNDNFLATTGFEQSEVLGKHHRMFCDPAYAATDAYREFWRKLGRRQLRHRRVQALCQGRARDLAQCLLQSDFRRPGRSRSRSSSTPPTSPRSRCAMPNTRARSTP
ncbi:PAS domain-containing protein [Massilia sp. B-10]|nr:PAS domain-containing protein [Massilia sp. B-10]